jgi:hypothetical protein
MTIKKCNIVMKLLRYNEFNNSVNEGLFKNFVGKVYRGLSKVVSKELNDALSGITKADNPDKIIKLLKDYLAKSDRSIKIMLNKSKDIDELKKVVKDELLGLYTVINGIKLTNKVDKYYFDEIFKNANKDLVKVMSNNDSKISLALDDYIDKSLIPGLMKISNVGDVTNDGDLKKLKNATYKWLINLYQPILKSKYKKKNKNKSGKVNTDFIAFNGGNNYISDQDARKILNRLSLGQIKKLRDDVGLSNKEVPIHSKK